MPQIDYKSVSIRAAAILTGSYVAGTTLTKVREYNQLILYVDFTLGSLTTAELKIQFAPLVSSDLYQETDETSSVAANVDTKAVNSVIHQFSVTGKYRLQVPVTDDIVIVSVKGTGTVTSSSMAVSGVLAKTYS